jgi:hypothetical protein
VAAARECAHAAFFARWGAAAPPLPEADEARAALRRLAR